MKTLLYRVRLFDGDDLDFPVLFLSYLCKALMIVAISFLVFLLTSKNYHNSSFGNNEVITSQETTAHPPSPF
ncbi:hypothetical protein [Gramella sp. MAR_2010_147]|uniref:hypothetical protein n=1 Tax=Gramella sp. MAR_2010_147 TaxID=1250205 RepID=UPI0008795179|nr:hypothetical protein [Gramella sp. MAR_2010_147]SDS30663.1 hypothetical protein SAMN04488553_1955 [Gramella sp. MAR_2010_147]